MPVKRTLLFGAGASVDAQVPDARLLARTVYDAVKKLNSDSARALDIAIAGLRFQRSIVNADPFGEIDVEDVYATLHLLETRDSHLLAPFVSAWIPEIAAVERSDPERQARQVAEVLGNNVHSAAEAAVKNGSADRYSFDVQRVADELGRLVSEAVSLARNPFREAALLVIQCLGNLLWVRQAERVEHLLPLLRSSTAQPVWIASLNYDNTIELAAKSLGVPIDCGLQSGKRGVQVQPSSTCVLLKLHGSLNWKDGGGGLVHVADYPFDAPTLVFGSANKLRIDGPYLDLLFLLRKRLADSEELYVCGYSFRDTHVNHLLLDWLDAVGSRKIVVVDPILSRETIETNVRRALPPDGQLPQRSLLPRVILRSETMKAWIAAEYQ